jgi:hypothetical protein
MRTTRFTWLLTLLLLLSVALLTGCAPRAGSGEIAGEAGEAEVVVDLPAIVIDYDAAGEPSVGGIPLSQFSGIIPPEVADQLVLGPDMVSQLQGYNIQNLQVNNRTDGLDILVNGLEVPSVSWDDESLSSLMAVAGVVSPEMAALEDLLPMLTNLGFAAVLRLPAAEGAEVAPIYAESTAAADTQAAQDEFLSTVEAPPLINVPISFEADGTWSMAGLSQDEWQALTGQPMDALELPPTLLESLIAAGISEATIATGPDGVTIMVNENALPTLSWSDGKINNLLDLLVQSGNLGGEGDTEAIMGLVNQLLPIIQTTDLNIHVFFPQ